MHNFIQKPRYIFLDASREIILATVYCLGSSHGELFLLSRHDMETDNVTQKQRGETCRGGEKGEGAQVEEREAARDNDTEELGIMGWFTRRHKLRGNQLARPPLTTRSCSELSSRRSRR